MMSRCKVGRHCIRRGGRRKRKEKGFSGLLAAGGGEGHKVVLILILPYYNTAPKLLATEGKKRGEGGFMYVFDFAHFGHPLWGRRARVPAE